jgi:membrane fusion protein (multidrug efflux system)
MLQHLTQKIPGFSRIPLNKKTSISGVVVFIIIGSLIYWCYSSRYISTDDAYLNAHVVQIAPRVTGPVSHLTVTNNQFVQQGHVLFEIDSTPFTIAIEKAQAQLAIDQAKLQDAQLTAQRTSKLAAAKSLSLQAADDALANLNSLIAAVQLDKADLTQAQLNLEYTHVVAPTDGWITSMSLREGDIVQANQPIFAFVSNNEFWVDANFKETQLANLQPGQIATVKVDMYPQHVFKGLVESLSKGSGTVFSLLPPENATGNWVKVTQRVPVRVVVLSPDPRYPLRIGTTATVTVDTRSSSKS